MSEQIVGADDLQAFQNELESFQKTLLKINTKYGKLVNTFAEFIPEEPDAIKTDKGFKCNYEECAKSRKTYTAFGIYEHLLEVHELEDDSDDYDILIEGWTEDDDKAYNLEQNVLLEAEAKKAEADKKAEKKKAASKNKKTPKKAEKKKKSS